ncbi:hypothetical protein SAMN04487910_4126 [Aquimarina amphilecti]|uniref:Uncharacterized protein n=1 Tax=Aquimarina amphilecti TaxID=1038014 RepID=A0A1H7VNX3_AQUAM|nr:hypothetical protein [Aquimarina amphilecti]SEM10951.1 hypothetical protein SAMN04487910_4126 [Aquimarina amphilecti]
MKTYYNDTLRKVTFENKSIIAHDVIDYFHALSDHLESYIGFLNVYDDVIIFKWLAKNKWIIDHPVVPDTLHRQRYATKEECSVFIKKVYNEDDIFHFQGFEDVPIGEFTLDEMIAFREEDDYLLREEEPPTRKIIISKSTTPTLKKTTKSSRILGDITVPKEELRTKSITKVSTKKKKKTSPLKQFKESTEQLEKENKQSSIAKTSTKPILKKANKPTPIQDKSEDNSLLNLEKTTKPKKDIKTSLVMGEKLGKDQKYPNPPTSPKVKTKPNTVNKNKSTNNDNSLFSI